MSAASYIIAPLPLPPGPSPTIPVREYLNKYPLPTDDGPSVTNLFIEAMQTFMQMDDLDNELSYFRIAAIHGAPYVGWGKYPPPKGKILGGNFCVHNNVTFPTFHRVYMMLFEQRLYEIMGKIVATKPASEQAEWKALWQKWRLPTWKWGTPVFGVAYSVPVIYMLPNWPPNSNKPNPLWKFINPIKDSSGNPIPMGSDVMGRYRLPVVRGKDPTYWDECEATSRHAVVGSPSRDPAFIKGTNNFLKVNEELNDPDWYGPDKKKPKDVPTGSIKELVYKMLTTKYTNYGSFASTKWYPKMPAAEAINLEYIHNNIHNFTGGSGGGMAGHMADISVAAFDPIFWQHHAYIDELFAIWQALPQNKNHWFDNPFKDPDTRPDPLPTDGIQPFNFSDDRLYNSNDVRSIASLNYDYEFPKDPDQLAAWINKNFGVSRRDFLERARDLPGGNNSYVANVIYDKYALSGNYKIYFFFGPVSTDIQVSEYRKQKNYVGTVATLGNGVEGCANCEKQKEEGSLSRAQVILTAHLLNIALDKEDKSLPRNNLELRLEHDDGVSTFLETNLVYKVVGAAGEVVANGDDRLKDLKVTMLVGKVTHHDDDTKLSEFNELYSLFTIRQGNYVDEDPWQTSDIRPVASNYDN